MSLHEAEVDETLGIGIAADLAVGPPESHLPIDIADVQPRLGIDEGQA